MAALEARQSKLKIMSMNVEETRAYLTDTAKSFQQLAFDATHGIYNDTFFGSVYDSEKKLRAQVLNLNRAFGATMLAKGAKYMVQRDDKGSGSATSETGHRDENEKTPGRETNQNKYPAYLQPFLDLYVFSDPKSISESTLRLHFEHLAATNQGLALSGIPNQEIIIDFVKMQSNSWRAIAECHIENVTNYAKKFTGKLLSSIVGSDKGIEKALMDKVVCPFFDKKKALMTEKVEEIIRPYAEGYALPHETEFHDDLSNQSFRRLVDGVYDFLDERPRNLTNMKTALQMLVDIETSQSRKGNTKTTVDMATAHYEMSRRNFTQNIVNLVVESCLMRHIPEILTAEAVAQMDECRLRELVPQSQELQDSQERQLQILNSTLELIQEHEAVEKKSREYNYYFYPTGIAEPDDTHQVDITAPKNNKSAPCLGARTFDGKVMRTPSPYSSNGESDSGNNTPPPRNTGDAAGWEPITPRASP
ncbi:hypothetical protein G7Z17_g9320 [Cylindrodendrum hubeiense]|uniref:GED domain-containing protein n=1 Tax=Cylindrodendrum hubeiense TaxID=595255 RepID=A0A9P5H3K5_9HYPO|nr:hypothetical protein G7Z17_g9320 [Cylindrodendrum hubeiense]